MKRRPSLPVRLKFLMMPLRRDILQSTLRSASGKTAWAPAFTSARPKRAASARVAEQTMSHAAASA